MQDDQGVRVLVLLQQLVEEVAAGAEDHLVSYHLFSVAASQSDITEVGIFEHSSEGVFRESVEVIPFRATVLSPILKKYQVTVPSAHQSMPKENCGICGFHIA